MGIAGSLLGSKAIRNWIIIPIIILIAIYGTYYYVDTSYNPQSLDEAKQFCIDFCNTTQIIELTTQWEDQEYCTATFGIDGNRDGKIQIEERGRHCWESPIYENCQRAFSDAYGTDFSCVSAHCEEGCPATSCVDVGAKGIVCSELLNEKNCKDIGCTWDNSQCFGVLRDCPKDYDTCKKVETTNGCKWQQPQEA